MKHPEPVSTGPVESDPSLPAALGRHHSLPTAIADLVDNAIEAGAHKIVVRILERRGRATGLYLIDDGSGMDSAKIDEAMRYGGQRERGADALSHFGIGMKAASLSQADSVYIWSRRLGAPAVGRGLERASADGSFRLSTYLSETAESALNAEGVEVSAGTAIEWRDVRSFSYSPDAGEQRAWLEQTIESLRVHLGLVFHRIITLTKITIVIDVLDEDRPELGTVPRTVEPLNPFAYPVSGARDFPSDLRMLVDGHSAAARLHIWPARSTTPTWQLGGRPPLESEGIYVYRHNRLLQSGGWLGLTSVSADLAFARVELDVTDALTNHIVINPEKSGVELSTVLKSAWAHGRTDDDTSFVDYLTRARGEARQSRKRNPQGMSLPEPIVGLPPSVADVIVDNSEANGLDPVSIRWRGLPMDKVFQVDRENDTIWLNARYRTALGGGSGPRNDDAPVVKTLVFVLVGKHAASPIRGSLERRTEDALQEMLLAAVRAEITLKMNDETGEPS